MSGATKSIIVGQLDMLQLRVGEDQKSAAEYEISVDR
jgi:hypothetical protein